VSHYKVEILWERGDQNFVDNRYSRRHLLRFDGGAEVPGSSSPHVVPVPMSDASAVDPEEAFVASLSSCHMLWFLSLAAKRKLRVDRYFDDASGLLEKDAGGKLAMTRVTLRPKVEFSGDRYPTREELDQLHHDAHAECFLARSVKTEMRCEPVYD
jgi:organic hydroperoxide reductase OsmC/OhrA